MPGLTAPCDWAEWLLRILFHQDHLPNPAVGPGLDPVIIDSGRNIPAYGTTHADYFHGAIPCTRGLTREEVEGAYEKNTGKVILEAFARKDALSMPGVLVKGHGPFTWGKDCREAVQHAVVLEEVAKMAFRTEVLGHREGVDQFLLDKHYHRKHGKDAYYGQSE